MKTLDDHHGLCLKNDVLLLPDVLEKLPDVCLEQYGLDPCRSFSSPVLKLLKKKLGLDSEIDCLCSLKKEREEIFLTLVKDTGEPIINT